MLKNLRADNWPETAQAKGWTGSSIATDSWMYIFGKTTNGVTEHLNLYNDRWLLEVTEYPDQWFVTHL